MATGKTFHEHLLESLLGSVYSFRQHRIDRDCFSQPEPRRGHAARVSRGFRQYVWQRWFQPELEGLSGRDLATLGVYSDLLPRLAALYQKLGDSYSRDLLVRILNYRILGPERAALPLNNPVYWEQREAIRKLIASNREIQLGFLNWKLFHYRLAGIGYPMELLQRPTGIHHIFLLQQYRYRRSAEIGVEAGEYVNDAGACWGDASLYFAHRAGAAGKVFAFEFIPGNLEILEQNLALNPGLRGSVQITGRPLWSRSGLPMHYRDNGPGSIVSLEPLPDADGTLESLTIDDFVAASGTRSIDFIKMDIEGAELEALRGARATLKAFRPKLAISVYHKPEHLTEIPEFIESLDLGYRFYLDHFTTHAEETVLFAKAA